MAFGRLRANVWERNRIKLDTKLKVYKAVVLPTLLYACETWTVYQRHAKRLNHFHLSCLRKLLKIKWQDKIPDTEVLTKAGMQSMHTVLKLAQLRWTGHVIRMPDALLPKKVFYGELQEGKRSQGSQKKRYKDTLKASLKDFEIPMGSWEQTAQERSKWRGLINKGAALYEKKRICEAERKRRERKAKTNVPPSDSMTLTCSTCNRQFRARIGLVSHQITHKHISTIQEIMMVFLISERRTIMICPAVCTAHSLCHCDILPVCSPHYDKVYKMPMFGTGMFYFC